MRNDTSSNQKRSLRRLLRYAAPYRGKIIVALVCMACYALVNALFPFMAVTTGKTLQGKYARIESTQARDAKDTPSVAASEEKPQGKRLDLVMSLARSVLNVREWKFWHLGIAIAIIFLFKGVFAFLQRYLMEWVGKRVVTDLRDELYVHFHTLSVDFFSGARTGELISRITNDILAVEQAVSQVVTDIFLQPVSILFMLVVVLLMEWRLALIVFIVFPLIFIPLMSVGTKIWKNAGKIQSLLANLTAVIQETFSGIRVVRAFGMEKYETEKFGNENRKVFDTSVKLILSLSMVRPMIEFVGGLSVAVTLILGGALFKMDLPYILGFCTGVFLLYDPVKKLGQVNNRLQMGAAAVERVFSILDTKPTVVESPHASPIPRMRECVSYNGVNFAYDDELVLKDISFKIKRGQVVAFVGPSGTGKTTVVNLLLRFYDPTSGSITIDGVDIRDATTSSLREQMAIVSQEVILFNDTIAANIAYGRPETPPAQITEAAKAANAHRFISALPQGYETVVGEKGIKLSGGERQRIAIARAILKDPAILILDEATSALDTEAERLVQGAINRLMAGRTVLVIAHRLSTIINADAIIVLENGRVVQKGKHGELLQQGGLYKKLYDMQFKDVPT
jgi:subfamily B ATP-binding cassette protein MsbA